MKIQLRKESSGPTIAVQLHKNYYKESRGALGAWMGGKHGAQDT